MKKLQDLSTSNTETITISGAEYKKFQILKSENAELKQQNEWLMEQLHLAKKRMFGSSSEKASEEVMEQLSLLFAEPAV